MSIYPEYGWIDGSSDKGHPDKTLLDRLRGISFAIEESPFANNWILMRIPGLVPVLVVPMGKKGGTIKELRHQGIMWTFTKSMDGPGDTETP